MSLVDAPQRCRCRSRRVPRLSSLAEQPKITRRLSSSTVRQDKMTLNFMHDNSEFYVTFGIPSTTEHYETVVASRIVSTASAEDDAGNRLIASYTADKKLVRITIPCALIANLATPPSIRVVGKELHLTWRPSSNTTLFAVTGDVFFVKDAGVLAELQISLNVL